MRAEVCVVLRGRRLLRTTSDDWATDSRLLTTLQPTDACTWNRYDNPSTLRRFWCSGVDVTVSWRLFLLFIVRTFIDWMLTMCSGVNIFFFLPAGHRDAAGGGELPASVPQRDAAGQQRGVHEGEGQRSTRPAGGGQPTLTWCTVKSNWRTGNLAPPSDQNFYSYKLNILLIW